MPRIILLTFIIAALTACTTQAQPITVPTPEPTATVRTPAPSPTPRENPSATPTLEPNEPTPTIPPTSTTAKQNVPNLSAVTLYGATPLAESNYFQISLEGWPEDAPDGIIVRVNQHIYNCEILFPQSHPDRLYCWGPPPPKGTQATIQVIAETIPNPLLEIPFLVPSPEDG